MRRRGHRRPPRRAGVAGSAVDLDLVNETIRPKEAPKKWVFPTPAPRWIKLDEGTNNFNDRSDDADGAAKRSKRDLQRYLFQLLYGTFTRPVTAK